MISAMGTKWWGSSPPPGAAQVTYALRDISINRDLRTRKVEGKRTGDDSTALALRSHTQCSRTENKPEQADLQQFTTGYVIHRKQWNVILPALAADEGGSIIYSLSLSSGPQFYVMVARM